jgi:hypothetical protein
VAGVENWLPAFDAGGRREVDRPYSLKIAADIRAEPAPEGARLITETRVAATSFWALVVFRLYWLVVGPFSALIVVAGFGRRPARRQDSDRRMTSTFPRRLNVHFLGFAVWVRGILGMGQAAGSNQHS